MTGARGYATIAGREPYQEHQPKELLCDGYAAAIASGLEVDFVGLAGSLGLRGLCITWPDELSDPVRVILTAANPLMLGVAMESPMGTELWRATS